MFLGLNEIKKYKFRYALIGLVLVLIAYLIFVLTGLANGLASSNRLAIDSWNAQQIVLNSEANGSLTQSNLTNQQANKFQNISGHSDITQLSANVTRPGSSDKLGTQIIGINPNQSIYKELQIETGHKFTNNHQVIVDDSLVKDNGYRIGGWLKIANHAQRYQIVGTTKNAKLSVAPVIYASSTAVQDVKFDKNAQPMVSAIVLKHPADISKVSGTQTMSINAFINKLPGYTAQNNTFNFMIGFLLVITLFIIAIFLYVLTIQKIPFLAVMKVQGISNYYLLKSIVSQALLLAVGGDRNQWGG
ncbi:ABC transporter permease [Lactobacillus sp. Sy-1]|uniref:ABC transporter permease n=1 Tax=Lactobacillus sp. Sy-1 TaxID=2109645 RepID=UPI001C5982AB|nr:ABC transporter permease [Lactobacillus sp. Sy-1]MBW1604857.1 ABC transporter permease [Lactobacillus sp. Sy-1]